MAQQRVAGHVGEIWIYPVTSLAGTPVPAVGVDAAGLSGDRARTVVDADGQPLRSKDVPALAALAPTTDAGALSALLGRPVRLEERPRRPGDAPVHLVSRAAMDRAARGDVPAGCSPDDPRANLVVDLDGDDDERSWVGRTLRLGDAVLEVTRTPKHCLGVYAEVRHAGRVTVGDAVLL